MSTNANPARVTVYVVRAEWDLQPESYLGGVYPSENLAQERCISLRAEGFDLVWYDAVEIGPNGGHCWECNR